MFWDSLLQFGVPLLQGFFGNKAANAQQQGAQAGLDFTKQVYGDAQGNLNPFISGGQGALSSLANAQAGDYSGFNSSPDYLWALQQGLSNMDNGAAAQLRLNSGGLANDRAKYAEGLATQNLNNWANRNLSIAQLGAQSAGQLGSLGTQNAGLQSQLYGNKADAQAAGYYNTAGTLGNLANLFGSSYNTNPITPAQVAQPTLSSYSAPYHYGP